MRRVLFVLAVLATAVFASTASASQLIDRSAHGVKLVINGKGEALVTYTKAGKVKRVLAWGAVNASPPTRAHKQVAFKLDYSGGWGKYHTNYYLNFAGSCLPYDGPPIAWEVTACKAPDGSYWAVQAWQRMLPNYGVKPTAAQAAPELRLSHWTGQQLPILAVTTDWAWHQWDHIFGTYTYGGVPVYGFKATAGGNPLDTFGRNIYVDTYDSTYGTGWRRENSFLTHTGDGAFCYSFNPHGAHPSGKGTRYRATVEGPGVAPDVMWMGNSPGAYDKDADAVANAQIVALNDKQCKAN